MNRQQLAHVLRAACQIADDEDVLVLGSQAILGSFDEDDLPPPATASLEADLAFLDDPDRAKADLVDEMIGEFTGFHSMNGYYPEGIHLATALLPAGWRERLVGWDLLSSEPAHPRFLEPHDLAISKLAAGREKDKQFVDALLRAEMLDVRVLRERNELLDNAYEAHRSRIRTFLGHYDQDEPHRR